MIFVDSNVPMYLVGGEHPNKDRARAIVSGLLEQRVRLFTSVEVYQELLHRYASIRRLDALGEAFGSLDSVVDEVLPFDLDDVRVARDLVESIPGLSARDALHVAVMRSAGIERILSFDSGFDACPGIERLA